jgi:hypothetical protein
MIKVNSLGRVCSRIDLGDGQFKRLAYILFARVHDRIEEQRPLLAFSVLSL